MHQKKKKTKYCSYHLDNNPDVKIVDLSDTAGIFKIFNQKTGADEQMKCPEAQKVIYSIIAGRQYPRNHCMSYTQYGKKCGDDVPVITTDGWKRHGDLDIGDKVFSPDGKPVRVLDTMNDGRDIEYEVEFSNGEIIQAHAQHEWLVAKDSWKNSHNLYRIKETQDILEDDYSKMSMPLVSPLEFDEKELPLDPYFFGAWLGDGTSSNPVITGVSSDDAIINKIPYKATSIQTHKDTGVKSYYFGGSKILKNLRKLGVYNNKHIPEIYKRSSVRQRLELLAGMIDTDGSVNKSTRENGWRNSRVYIININKILIDDFIEIVESLGIRTSVTKVNACISTSGIEGKSDTYYIGFQPFIDIPTVLKRKRIHSLDNQRRIRIKDIRKIEPINGKCISVEGGMYLVGKKLIPTHNSSTVAAAVLARVISYPEKWAIVAPSQPKAQIIMRKIFEFCDKTPEVGAMLEMESGEKKGKRLLKEASKKRVVFKNGGEIFVLSADNRNKAAAGEALMGFGSPNVVLDESSLIDDEVYAKIFRMLGGSADNFIFEIGNPFNRNHFLDSWNNDKYYKIMIDWRQGVKEGRITREFVEEMREKFDFGVMYDCNFPEEDDLDRDGWSLLFPENTITSSFRKENPNTYGEKRLGVDVARSGGNYNVWVLRTANYAEIIGRTTTTNLMDVIGTTKQLAQKHRVMDNNIYLDATGMGAGVYDRFRETGWGIKGINMAESATNKDKFINIRAEAYIRCSEWLNKGGTLNKDSKWLELRHMRYKTRDNGKIKIISKGELRDKSIQSPDVADALMLTFTRPDSNIFVNKKLEREKKRKMQPNYR